MPKYTNSNLSNYTQGSHRDESIINEKYKSDEKRTSHELGFNVVKDETKTFSISSLLIYLIVGLIISGIILTIILSAIK